MTRMEALFEKLGNLSTVNNLANEFYEVMDHDPKAKELRAIHPENMYMSKKTMYRFLSHWSGGPKLFSDEYVNGKWLELRHRNVELSEQHRQHWLYCMETAMANLHFNNDLIQELLSRFSSLINAMIANDQVLHRILNYQITECVLNRRIN